MGLGEPTLIGDVPDDHLEQRTPFLHEQSRRETGFILLLPVSWSKKLLLVVIFYMLILIPMFTCMW